MQRRSCATSHPRSLASFSSLPAIFSARRSVRVCAVSDSIPPQCVPETDGRDASGVPLLVFRAYGGRGGTAHHELHGLEEHRVRGGGAAVHPPEQVGGGNVEVVPQVRGAAEKLGGAVERAR